MGFSVKTNTLRSEVAMAKATTIFNAIKVNLKYANYGSFGKFVQAP